MSAYTIAARSLTAGRGRLVAALLVVTLILCHGALGALHQASSWSAEYADGHHATTAVPPAAVNHHAEHHGGPVVHTDYAAALFVVLLGAALVLLSGRFLALTLAAAHRLFGRVFLPLSLLPPRGPTLPLLQVFRL